MTYYVEPCLECGYPASYHQRMNRPHPFTRASNDAEIEKTVVAEGTHLWDCQCGVHEWNEEENLSYKEAMDRNRV